MDLNWKPEYSVEVKEIDDQHKKIFEILKKLDASIKDKREHEFLTKVIEELIDYSVYHFETEEKYFEKFDYEFKEEHKTEHESFKKQIQKSLEENNIDEEKVTKELLEFVLKWIVGHVLGSDQKYIKCFHDHGLK